MNVFLKLDEAETAFIRTWYGTNQDFSNEIKTIMEKNPFYFSNSIVFCRNKAKSIRSLVLLSMCSTEHCKNFFVRIFNDAIKSIPELILFIEEVKKVRGYGTVIHKAVNKWFNSLKMPDLERELANNFNNKASTWKNRDLLNMFHVKPKNRFTSAVLRKYCTMDKVRQV